jgi:hypothetical protein
VLTHIRPSRLRFTCRTRPIFNGTVDPAQSPGPPKARQMPRAPSLVRGVTSHDGTSRTPSEGSTPPSPLIRAHAPDQIPPTVFGFPRTMDLCRLLSVPAARWPFPTLSLRIFPSMLGPLPRRRVGCIYPLLPQLHRPSPSPYEVG